MALNPRGIRNHNPGNIERNENVRWQGQSVDQSSDPRFVVFDAPKWGIRAIARVLITYQDHRQARDGSKIDTLRDIISRWAPPNENDTPAYLQHVATLTLLGIDETIDVYDYATMRALVIAIITHENGCQPYDDATIDAGIRLAGIEPPRPSLAKRPDVIATASAGLATVAGTAVEVLQSQLPHAMQTAQAIEPVAPGWGRPLLLLLILGLLTVALIRRIRDERAAP